MICSKKKEILEEMHNKLLDYETYIDEEKKDFQIKVQQFEESIKAEKNRIRKLEEERNSLIGKISKLSDKPVKPAIYPSDVLNKEMREIKNECELYGIVTQNRQTLETFITAKKIAVSDEPAIILGETGTGKEPLAEAIHAMSRRKDKTMVTVNIPAIPETLLDSEMFGYVKGAFTGANAGKMGKFEIADKSTVFLDEIGDTKPDLQAKLLRVLQEKTIDKVGSVSPMGIKVDIRIISATNKDIENEVKEKRFREDLYYRLNVHTLKLLPLRERKEDILLLAEHFIKISNIPYKKLDEGAVEKLTSYSWPGNIRQLKSIIYNALVLSDKTVIEAKDIHLPEIDLKNKTSIKDQIETLKNVEDEVFLEIMEKNNYEIETTAKILNQSRNTVSLRFKGICFQLLSENRWDSKLTLEKLTNDPKQKKLLEARINEYYDNLVNVIKDCSNKVSALEECQRRFKNLPKKYHKYLEEVIDKTL